jgi:anti-sigma factor RsiW
MDTPLMTCQELVELVTAYQNGTLPATERARFDEHLAQCPPCTLYVEQMALTVRAAGGLNEELTTAESTQQLLSVFRSWKQEKRATS